MASSENQQPKKSALAVARPPSAAIFRVPTTSEISIRKQLTPQRLWMLLPQASTSEGQLRLEQRLQERLRDRLSLMRYRSPQELHELVQSSPELKFVIVGDAEIQWACRWAVDHRSSPCELLYCTEAPDVVRFSELVTAEQLQQFKLVTNSYTETEKYLLAVLGEGQFRLPYQAKAHIVFDPALAGQLEQSMASNPTLKPRIHFCAYTQNNHQSLVQALKVLRVQPNDHIFVVVNESSQQQIQVTQKTAAETMRKDNPNINILLISLEKYQRGVKQEQKTVAVFPTSVEAAHWLLGILEGGVSPMHSRDVNKTEAFQNNLDGSRSERSAVQSNVPSDYIIPDSSLSRQQGLPTPIAGVPAAYSNGFRPQSPVLRRVSSPVQRPIQQAEIATVPRVFIQQSASRWRYFLKKYSQLTKRFTSDQYESLEDLATRVNKFLSQNQNDKAWILLEDSNELQRHRQKLNNANVKYLVYDPIYQRPTQEKDIIMGSDMRDELESYLLNYQKQSRNIISPSHLNNSKNILLLFHKSIQLDTQQLGLWKQRLYSSNVEIGNFAEGPRMMKAIATYPKYSAIIILPQRLDNEFAPALATHPNVKKIVLLEPPMLRPSYFEHPSVMFVAQNPNEINGFLKTLRYSLRHPPKNIAQIFLKPLTNVFIQRDRYDMQYLQFIALLNPSVRLYQYSTLQELYSLLKADQHNDALIVGEADLKPKTLKAHHPHVHLLITNEFNHGGSNYIVMSTDDEREVLLYIKNLPNNRYSRARIISSPVDVYLDSTAQASEELKNSVQDIMQVNSSLAVYTYEKLSQLEQALQNSKGSGSTSIVVTEQLEPNRTALEALIAEKRKEKRDISGVLLENGNTPVTEPQLYMFSDSRLECLVEFFDNIPDVLANKINSVPPTKSPTKVESLKSVKVEKQPSIAKITKSRDSELITPIIPVPGMPNQKMSQSNDNVPQPQQQIDGKLQLPLPPTPVVAASMASVTPAILAPIVVPIRPGSTEMIPISIQILPQMRVGQAILTDGSQQTEMPYQSAPSKSPSVSSLQQQPEMPMSKPPSTKGIPEPAAPASVPVSVSKSTEQQKQNSSIVVPMGEPAQPQSNQTSGTPPAEPNIPFQVPPKPSSPVVQDPRIQMIQLPQPPIQQEHPPNPLESVVGYQPNSQFIPQESPIQKILPELPLVNPSSKPSPLRNYVPPQENFYQQQPIVTSFETPIQMIESVAQYAPPTQYAPPSQIPPQGMSQSVPAHPIPFRPNSPNISMVDMRNLPSQQLRESQKTATFNSFNSSQAKVDPFSSATKQPQSEISNSSQNSPNNLRRMRPSMNIEQKPTNLSEYKSKPHVNSTENERPLQKPSRKTSARASIKPTQEVGQQLPKYVSAQAASASLPVNTVPPSPIITPTKPHHNSFGRTEYYSPYSNLNNIATPVQQVNVEPHRHSGAHRSPNIQYSPRSAFKIISNPLVDISTDNSQFVADNPLDQTESSLALITVCLLYSNNFEATRYKDYIERVADRTVAIQSIPFRSMQELEALISKTYDNFNKTLILLSHEFRGIAQKCEEMQRTRGKLRTYLLTSPLDLTELMNVVNVGSEWTLVGLPYRTETLPLELQLSKRLKVLLPSDYFRDLYRKVALTDFIRYDTPADIDTILSSECDPTIYNIVVVSESRLADTYRYPLQYDNTRMVVLAPPEGLSEGKMFSHYGDMFWLFADSNPQSIEHFLMTLTNIKKNDVPPQLYSDKPLLFYQKNQLDQLYFFEYLGYFKVQYTDNRDLQRKVSLLMVKCSQRVRAYILNDENGVLRIEEISKAEMEYIASDSPRVNTGGPFGIPSPSHSPTQTPHLPTQTTHLPTQTAVYVQQSVTQLPIRSEPPVLAVPLPLPTPEPVPVVQPQIKAWITTSGEFILDAGEPATTKQRMLIRMFDHDLFRKYGKFGYYYLSSSQQESPVADLQYRTTEQMYSMYQEQPGRLMVVFCDRGDERFLPVEMLNSDRVRLIKICQEAEHLDSLHLKCQQIEGVINRVKTIEANCRNKYVVFKQKSAQCEVLLQEFLLHSKDFIRMDYKDPEDFDKKIASIKNKYRKLQVICPESEQTTLKRVLDVHRLEAVAFMTARSQTDMSELPSDSTLRKQIENLKIEQSPTIRKVQPVNNKEVVVSSTETLLPSNVVRHEVKMVASPVTSPVNSPINSPINSSRQRNSTKPLENDPPAVKSPLPPRPSERQNSELKIRPEPRNQTWLNGVFERLNRCSRIMVIHDHLSEEERSTVNRLAELTSKISYVRPRTTAEYEYFLKSSPQGIFLLVGNATTHPHVSPTHRQSIQLDSEDLDKLLKMMIRSKKIQNRSSRSLNKEGALIGSDSNLGADSREDSDSGEQNRKRRSRLKLESKPPSGPEEKTQQIDEYMMIKSRINARENRFINILNGEELTIFVPGARQNLEKLLQEETPEVTVIPYESSQQVESHLPKCSKRPTLVLAPDDKLLAMEKLTEKFPQVRIIASSNVEINHPSVCISLATDGEVLELVRRLRNRNNEVDQRRMEQQMRRLSRQEEQIFGYSMTLTLRSLAQKVVIFSASGKNTNIRNMVEKYNSTRVSFTEYLEVGDLDLKLKQLALVDAEALCLIIENDEQIEQIEALNTQSMRVYFVRCFNNHMRYSRELLLHNDRLIFTGNSSKEIANFINSLVYRSFKKLSKALEGKRKSRKIEARPSELGKGRSEYFQTNSASLRTGQPPLPDVNSNSVNSKAKILRHASSSGALRKSSFDTKHRTSQAL